MKFKMRVSYNAPVVLTFAILSGIVLFAGMVTNGRSTQLLFCAYRSEFSAAAVARLFFHVLGHSGWSHYANNMMLLLVIGPQLEEKYGSDRLLLAIVVTALVTGLAQWIFFPGVGVLGASGIVFMMILMASMGGMKDGYIPFTLILVALIYIGGEVISGITVHDTVSQLSHIVGGICGAVFGFLLERR